MPGAAAGRIFLACSRRSRSRRTGSAAGQQQQTDMGTALAARLGLGLLLMALLLPTQIYCDAYGTNGTSPTPSNSSSASSTYLSAVTNSLNNTTTQGHGNSLHSTTSLLFILSVSLLYFCC